MAPPCSATCDPVFVMTFSVSLGGSLSSFGGRPFFLLREGPTKHGQVLLVDGLPAFRTREHPQAHAVQAVRLALPLLGCP